MARSIAKLLDSRAARLLQVFKYVWFVGGYAVNVLCDIQYGFISPIDSPDYYLQIILVCLLYISPVNKPVQRDEVPDIQLQCRIDGLLEFRINETGLDFFVEFPHTGKGLFMEGDDDNLLS